jgi:hypothetical protein
MVKLEEAVVSNWPVPGDGRVRRVRIMAGNRPLCTNAATAW